MDEQELPPYAAITELLEGANALIDGAELQGLITGFLICQMRQPELDGMAIIREQADVEEAQLPLIDGLVQRLMPIVAAQLADQELRFQLFLPGDEVAIEERVVALAKWSEGFLFAISQQGEPANKEVAELLEDFAAIAAMDVEQLEGDQDEERNYIEVGEFIRIGVIFIYDDSVLV